MKPFRTKMFVGCLDALNLALAISLGFALVTRQITQEMVDPSAQSKSRQSNGLSSEIPSRPHDAPHTVVEKKTNKKDINNEKLDTASELPLMVPIEKKRLISTLDPDALDWDLKLSRDICDVYEINEVDKLAIENEAAKFYEALRLFEMEKAELVTDEGESFIRVPKQTQEVSSAWNKFTAAVGEILGKNKGHALCEMIQTEPVLGGGNYIREISLLQDHGTHFSAKYILNDRTIFTRNVSPDSDWARRYSHLGNFADMSRKIQAE